MRGDESRQSRPSVMRWTPASAKYAPMARPRSATKSSGKSRSATPRMSYSRKTLGFIGGLSQQIGTAGLLGGVDHFSYILRAVPRHDQNRVAASPRRPGRARRSTPTNGAPSSATTMLPSPSISVAPPSTTLPRASAGRMAGSAAQLPTSFQPNSPGMTRRPLVFSMMPLSIEIDGTSL